MRKNIKPPGISIGIGASFEKESGDATPCYYCKEPIFGNRFNLVLKIAGSITPTEVNLCENCYAIELSSLRG